MTRSPASLERALVLGGLTLPGSVIVELETENEWEWSGVGLGKTLSYLAPFNLGTAPFGWPITLEIAIESRIGR